MSQEIVILNFHGIGSSVRAFEPGEEPYWISVAQFEEVLHVVAAAFARKRILITFDDGNSSDAEIAVPRLKEAGMRAAFFVLAGKVGQPGYLSAADLAAMDAAGMAIGSHGFDHVDWRRLATAELEREVAGSKRRLEDILGRPVAEAAIPFGSYDRKVLAAVRTAGYGAVYSSDGGTASAAAWLRPRTSVRRDTDVRALAGLIDSGIGWRRRLRRDARMLLKRIR